MKWFIGFFVLLVALVTISGCTQPAQTAAPVTTVPTTVQTTAPVIVATPVPTTIATQVATTVATTKVATTVPTTVSATQTTASNSTLVVVQVTTVAPASMVTTIHITKTGFDPKIDVILPGTGISWVNDDSVPHAITGANSKKGNTVFTSTSIEPNSKFQYDFGDEGTFEYALIDLPKLNGTIIVKTGGSLTSYST
jgi:plastocyanin